jgi:hypothetical protein
MQDRGTNRGEVRAPVPEGPDVLARRGGPARAEVAQEQPAASAAAALAPNTMVAEMGPTTTSQQ